MRTRVLVVDDELAIRNFLHTSLEAFGYEMIEAATGEEALRRAARDAPAAIVLDLGLPDLDGVAVVRRLREWSKVPVIVLSARLTEQTKIEALDAGADDYVTKPFGIGELMARLRASLRRRVAEEVAEPVFDEGGLRVHFGERRVAVNDRPVQLSPKEWELLRLFVVNTGKLLTHAQLMRELWPNTAVPDIQNLRVLVGQLRRKIEPMPALPRYILSEPGAGYRLKTADEDPPSS